MGATERTLTELFARQVQLHPEATAVECAGAAHTYATLDAASSKLACRLAERGITTEHTVAVLMRRSADLIVALLGVLKAGAAYLPIELRSPARRQEAILRNAGAQVVLTDGGTDVGRFAAGPWSAFEVRDELARAQTDGGGPVERVAEDQLAYVMHTSGSTGQPKGVAVTHRNVVDLALDPCWGVDRQSRVLFHAPHAFDASTYELWVPLLAGGCVVVAPEGSLDGTALRRLLRQHRITHVHVTAGLFRVVSEAPECFATVKEVLTGGDVVPPVAVRQVRAALPHLAIRHLYGPTEMTLCATQHLVRDDEAQFPVLPIGAPLKDTRAYVLDGAAQPARVDTDGELCLAGAGLARGYLNDPARTAERFVADPFGPPGARMYRTGDLARHREDDRLELRGRADDQVKVRGFRVEPGEVEAALSQHRGVRQVAAIVHEDAARGAVIVAYVVARHDDGGLVAELHELAGMSLPDYLIPSTFVIVPALPLTPNGKLDRAALPAPTITGSGVEATTALETLLCRLIGEVLGVAEVGVDDNFFDLGGHSILAAKLVTRIYDHLGVELGLDAVVSSPTAASLAAHLQRNHDKLDQVAADLLRGI